MLKNSKRPLTLKIIAIFTLATTASNVMSVEGTGVSVALKMVKKLQMASTPYLAKIALDRYGLEDSNYPFQSDKFNESDEKNITAAATASVPVSSKLAGVEYIGSVGIGTPPQNFSIVFDTGSADIWIPSSDCTGCGGKARFFANESTTFRSIPEQWTITYGDGSKTTGNNGNETVTVGEVSVNDFKIGLANKEDVLFQMDPYLEGIFGLSFLSLSVYQKVKDKPTIVELLKSNGKIENAVVGIWLGRAVSDNGEGEVMIGDVNPGHYKGKLQYISVDKSKGSWQVPINGIILQSDKKRNILYGTANAYLDTGTTLILMPSDISQQIHKDIPGATFDESTGWSLPCSSSSNTKNLFTFKLGDYDFEITIADLVREVEGVTEGSCYSGIAETNSKSLFILGNTFLRSYYTAYDYTNGKVGLAQAKA